MPSSCDSTEESQCAFEDMVGLDVHYNNADLGAIDEMIEREGKRYFVLDTRHWTFGHRRIVPVERIGTELVRDGGKHVVRSLRADPKDIRDAPDFDPFKLRDESYWSTIDLHYELHPMTTRIEP